MKFYVCFLATVAIALAGQIQEVRVNPALTFLRINSAAGSRSSNDYSTSPDFRAASRTGNYVNRGVEAFRTTLTADPVVYRAGSLRSDSSNVVASRASTATQPARSVTPTRRTSTSDFITVNVVSNGPVAAVASSASSSSSPKTISASPALNVNSISTNAVTTNSAAGTRSSGDSYSTGQSFSAATAPADATYSSAFSFTPNSGDPFSLSSPTVDIPLPPVPVLAPPTTDYSYGQAPAPAADAPFNFEADSSFASVQATNEFQGIPGTANQDFPVFAAIPATSFSCANQQYSYGYYADVEASCQVFHICQDQGLGRLTQRSFLCPNGTIFDQRTLVCNWWYNVNCEDSTNYYSNNANFGVVRVPNVLTVAVPAPVPATVAFPIPVLSPTVTTYTLRATPELLELLQRSAENSAPRSANGAAY